MSEADAGPVCPPRPEVPPLDPGALRLNRVETPDAGEIAAHVPVDAKYIPQDTEAPALVCLPGLGLDGDSYLRQLPLGALAHLHFLRFAGRAVPGEKGLGQLAHWAEAYITKAGLEARRGGVVLLGLSMGGAVALTVALRGKVRLRGLVLLSTFGATRHLGCAARCLAPLAWVCPQFVLRFATRTVFRVSKHFGDFSAEEAAYLVSCIRIFNQASFARSVQALMKLSLVEEARRLAVPTLVIHGTADSVLPVAAGRELADAIPGAQRVLVDGANHALFLLQYRQANEAVGGFLVRLVAHASSVQPKVP